MNGNCIDIGTIQAFLDGETTPAISAKVTHHAAVCDDCALLLAEAEEENSLVFSALGREMDTLVPTQRLWGRINDSIAEEKSRMPIWKRALAFVSINLANPSFAAAARILIVFGVFAAVWNLQPNVSTSDPGPVATTVAPPVSVSKNQTVDVAVTGDGIESVGQSADDPLNVTASNLPPKELKKLVTAANFETGSQQSRPQYAVIRDTVDAGRGFLPGEESYVKTISGLKQNIDGQKDATLRPSSRISYERDMAVVDDSIKRMRQVVRKNPRNQAAKQVLYASYQDKIDLLNSVAQREDLMASVR